MKYKNLLSELEDMTEAQLEHPVVISVDGVWTFPTVVAVVKNDHNEGEEGSEERFAKLQTILM